MVEKSLKIGPVIIVEQEKKRKESEELEKTKKGQKEGLGECYVS